MKFIYCMGCLAILILMSGICGAAGIATVHGVAYEWSTFEPLDNAVIEVNSTPTQSLVAKYGVYSFELPNGTYHLTAEYYQDGVLSHYGEETITVSDDGNYVVDLLLLPSYSESSDIESSLVSAESNIDDPGSTPEEQSGNLLVGASVAAVLVLGLLFYQVRFKTRTIVPKASPGKRKSIAVQRPERLQAGSIETADDDHTDDRIVPPGPAVQSSISPVASMGDLETYLPTESSPENVEKVIVRSSEPVPRDLQEILDILRSQGGRMTQKDMRKRLRYSEGKVSLMLLDLENRGKIRKFKKGRGNILFLMDDED